MRLIFNVGPLLGRTVVFGTTGCTTTESGIGDTDRIGTLLARWKDAILAADAGNLMAAYSENFAHNGDDYGAKDKTGLGEFIEAAIAQGRFDEVELYMDDMAIAIREDTGTVYPIEFTNREGTITIELGLTREETGWLITDMAIEGM